MELVQAMKQRRSQYDINDQSLISDEQIEKILTDAITYVPSAFHSQTSRVVLLLGERHKKLWTIVKETLRAIVLPEKFDFTDAKINTFAAGHGTILFLEDNETIEQLQKDFPSYASNFPIWSLQSAGMLQYAVWTALSSEGLGASLQHYNPLIDEEVEKEMGYCSKWKLLAQMPFGLPNSAPQDLVYKPIEERLFVLGGQK